LPSVSAVRGPRFTQLKIGAGHRLDVKASGVFGASGERRGWVGGTRRRPVLCAARPQLPGPRYPRDGRQRRHGSEGVPASCVTVLGVGHGNKLLSHLYSCHLSKVGRRCAAPRAHRAAPGWVLSLCATPEAFRTRGAVGALGRADGRT